MRAVSVGTLALLLFSLYLALRDAPALSASARMEGGYGSWLTASGPSLYDPPLYRYEVAQSRILAALERGDVTGLAEAETALRLTLSLAPADAYAWVSLAWTKALQGDSAAAWSALGQSWRAAPHNKTLALDRSLLADFLGDPNTESERANIAQDRRLLEARAPQLIDAL